MHEAESGHRGAARLRRRVLCNSDGRETRRSTFKDPRGRANQYQRRRPSEGVAASATPSIAPGLGVLVGPPSLSFLDCLLQASKKCLGPEQQGGHGHPDRSFHRQRVLAGKARARPHQGLGINRDLKLESLAKEVLRFLFPATQNPWQEWGQREVRE